MKVNRPSSTTSSGSDDATTSNVAKRQKTLQTETAKEPAPGQLDRPPCVAATSHAMPVHEQVSQLLEEWFGTQAEEQPDTPSTAQTSVGRILSSVQTFPDLPAAFKLLDAPWFHDAAGQRASTLAVLCLRQ